MVMRSLKTLSFVGGLVIPAFILGACGSGTPGTTGSTGAIIGVATPESGPDGSIGVPIANGVQLAVQLANAKGGLPGTLGFQSEDDQETPDVGVTVARQYCSTPAVIGVVGDLASTVTQATQGIYNGCNLVQVTPTSSLDNLSQKGYHNFFRTTALNKDYGGQTVAYVAKLPGVKTIATIDDNESTTIGLAQTFVSDAKTLGLTTLNPVHVTTNGADFRGALTPLIAEKPDLIYLSLFVNDAALVDKQAQGLGYTGLFMGIDGDIAPTFAQLAGPGAEGHVYFSTVGLDPTAAPTSAVFAAAYKKTFGVAADTFAANAFDAATAIIDAWKAAGTNDRKTIIAKMAHVTFQGTTGTISFTSTGDLTRPIVGIWELKNGQIGYLAAAQ